MNTLTMLAIVSVCLVRFYSAHVFTSVYNIGILYENEGRLIKALMSYIKESSENDTHVSHDVISFADAITRTRADVRDTETWVGNPINALHLVTRIANGWENIFNSILCEYCEFTFASKGFNISKTAAVAEVKVWPSTTDVTGILQSIIRLWTMYNLDLPALIRGRILHTRTDPLTDREVVAIAEILGESGDKYSGILWLDALSERKKVEQENKDGSIPDEIINSRLARYYNQYGMPWKSAEVLEQFQLNGSKRIKANYNYFRTLAAETRTGRRTFSPPPSNTNAMDITYKELCNRNNRTISHMSSFRCILTKTTIPFIRGKEEVLNHNPRISMFHDVISKSDIEKIKVNASKHFRDSSVVYTNGTATDVLTRLSQTHWMCENDFIRRLAWKIGILTGLSTTFREHSSDSEPLQVLNYGCGGMYHPHVDPLQGTQLPDYLVGSGDRIATWMFYLSSVTAGGATVFPRLRVRIPVEEGAAAFWYNLLEDGRVDHRTLHAGCPVLLGSKWVANRWIHSDAQMFNRPCTARQRY